MQVGLVGLDLDGTLIDSAPDLSDALGRALAALDLPAPAESAARGWIGDGVEALVESALVDALGRQPSAGESAAALATFDEHYSSNHSRRSRPYAGVLASLQRLRSTGIALACLTNKRQSFATAMLEAAGIAALLDLTIGGDAVANRKPAPDQLHAAAERLGVAASAAVMVGDSPNDFTAARAAGWRFVFAAYGYTAAMTAANIEPSTRVEKFDDLLPLLGIS